MKNFRFYKLDNKWYVDLPDWEGSIDELEMVCGADIMLDIISQSDNEIYITMSDTYFDNATTLVKYKDTPEIGGAEYIFTKWHNIDYDMNIWLCVVTEFVFGYLPNIIYII